MDNMERHPAWFTMILVALYGDQGCAEAYSVRNYMGRNGVQANADLRSRLINTFRETIMGDQSEADIPDAVLHDLADDEWNPSPVLASFNDLCMARGWRPIWHPDGHHLDVAGRLYKLSQASLQSVAKKKQRKARLAAMVLFDFDKTPKRQWLARQV